jgi:hypothetical protein
MGRPSAFIDGCQGSLSSSSIVLQRIFFSISVDFSSFLLICKSTTTQPSQLGERRKCIKLMTIIKEGG